MHTVRITANEAALIQRNLVASAIRVAKCETGINRLQTLALTNPELRALARQLDELRDHAEPMLLCDVPVTA
jgi:hypothetical protein